MIRRPLPGALVAACLTVGISGCGSSSPAEQVRAEVHRLVQAITDRDYNALCTQILDPSLVSHLTANDISCPSAMHLALGAVHDPTVSVGKVVVRGSRATAIALTSARGQRATVAAIRLRRTAHGWRITSLGSPTSAAQGG